MSIFIAGERNIIGRENLCTSFVFGTMEFLDSEIYLNEFLKQLDINISEEELKSSKFHFWEKLNQENRRIPDIIIETEKKLIYIENKVDSQADSAQLIDEFEDAKDNAKYKKDAFLIYITNDFDEPQDIRLDIEDGLKHEADKIMWYSWEEMDNTISSITENDSLDFTSKKLLLSLSNYLRNQILNKPKSYGAIVAINPDRNRDDAIWLQNVIDGKETIYNSNPVSALGFANQKILFFRTKVGIIGEATICDYYIDEEFGAEYGEKYKHFYDFRDFVKGKSTFILYPKPVKLSDLEESGRRPIVITSLPVDKEMYDKIRQLSNLE